MELASKPHIPLVWRIFLWLGSTSSCCDYSTKWSNETSADYNTFYSVRFILSNAVCLNFYSIIYVTIKIVTTETRGESMFFALMVS